MEDFIVALKAFGRRTFLKFYRARCASTALGVTNIQLRRSIAQMIGRPGGPIAECAGRRQTITIQVHGFFAGTAERNLPPLSSLASWNF